MFPGSESECVGVGNCIRIMNTAPNIVTNPNNNNRNFLDYLLFFTRFWGIFTAIVLCGIGVDFVFHRHTYGYYFIGSSALLLLLEITWVVSLFLQLCIRSDNVLVKCWSFATWIEGWKKGLLYAPLGALPLLWPHKIWLCYVSVGQIASLAVFHTILSFKTRRRKRKERLIPSEVDSLESSKFEEVTEVLDDGLPEPIPGSSHSLSDSLAEQDTILEI